MTRKLEVTPTELFLLRDSVMMPKRQTWSENLVASAPLKE